MSAKNMTFSFDFHQNLHQHCLQSTGIHYVIANNGPILGKRQAF